MPGKPFQSKLEPFYEFIREGRSKRWSYQKIAAVLTHEKGLTVSANAIFSFVKVRAKRRKLYALPPAPTSASSFAQAGGFFQNPEPNTQSHENKRKYNI